MDRSPSAPANPTKLHLDEQARMTPSAETVSTDPLLPESDSALAPGVTVTPAGLRLQFSRGGGPGGQNVNKLNTKAEIWITLGKISGLSPGALVRLHALAGRRLTAADELHLISEVHRTQEGNRREVFARVRELIVQAMIEPKRRRKTRPTAGSRKRRLDSKRHRSEIKARRGGRE
jgi:ribosome-associated protein